MKTHMTAVLSARRFFSLVLACLLLVSASGCVVAPAGVGVYHPGYYGPAGYWHHGYWGH